MTTDREVSTNLLAAGLFHAAAAMDNTRGDPDTVRELLRFCIAAMYHLGEDVYGLVGDALDDQSEVTNALHARTEHLMRNANYVAEGIGEKHRAEPIGQRQLRTLAKSIGTLVGMSMKSSQSESTQGAALFLAAIKAESEVSKELH